MKYFRGRKGKLNRRNKAASSKRLSRRTRQLELEPLEHRNLLAFITTGTVNDVNGDGIAQFGEITLGPGDVTVNLDGYGSFGARTFGGPFLNAIGAIYKPTDTAGQRETIFDSALAVRLGSTSSGIRNFLTSGFIDTAGGLPNPAQQLSFVSSSSNFLVTDVGEELTIVLLQGVEKLFNDEDQQVGSVLTQSYFITNTGDEIVDFEFVRYQDAGLDFIISENPGCDGGGRIVFEDNTVLLTIDEAGRSVTDANTVWLTSVGGDIEPGNRYEIEDWFTETVFEEEFGRCFGVDPFVLATQINSGGPLDNEIFNDTDNNGFIDPGLDIAVTMALRNPYESLEPGNSRTYFTSTTWGLLTEASFQPPDPSEIRGVKFDDLNGNGERDAGEPGLAGWTIFLDFDEDGVLDDFEPRDITGLSGAYSFDTLPPGIYQVREVLQPLWTQTNPALGFHEVTLGFGEIARDIDFGNSLPRIAGSKFHDLDGNGFQNGSEPFLAGWTIFLDLNGNGILDSGEPTSVTDENGQYLFANLASDTYIVREVLQPGWQQTAPPIGFFTVEYTSGSTVSGLDFGNQNRGEVSGVKFHDINGNGVRNATEPLLEGWTIFSDANNNGVLDPTERFGVTNASGEYSLGNLDPTVIHRVREVLQPNWEQTFPGGDGSYTLDLSGGKKISGIDFGNIGFGSVEGVVYNDINGSGTPDFLEGIPSIFAWLDDGDGVPDYLESSTLTGSDGSYGITRITPGTYQVRIAPPGGVQVISPMPDLAHTVVIEAGDELEALDFGTIASLDWGDAPFIYPVLDADFGANHGTTPGFHLGLGDPGELLVDGEADGQPGAAATRDDLTGLFDDGDGVDWIGNDPTDVLVAGATKSIFVYGSPAQDISKGKLQGWIDFNGDGDWTDAGEQIISDLIIATGINELSIPVPVGAVNGPTYARFRISHESGLGFSGPAEDGEVEDYLVNIVSSNDIVIKEDLETVVDEVLIETLTTPSNWYEAVATQTGIFRVDATFLHEFGNIDIAVYDSDFNLLAEGSTMSDDESVSFDSIIGETYFIRVLGTHPLVTLQFLNNIAMNSPLTFIGSGADDQFEFIAGTTTHVVIFNGVVYEYEAGTVDEFIFEGNGGNDSAVVRLIDGTASAVLHPNQLSLAAIGYQLDANGVEDIRVFAGAGDTIAHVYDSPNKDRYIGKPEYGLMRGEDFEYFNYVKGFNRVLAYANAGGPLDIANLYDSIYSDRFIGRPEYGIMRGENFEYYHYAEGFDRVLAYALLGGDADIANLYDSLYDDRFIGRPQYSLLRSVNNEFYNYAKGFDRVNGFATTVSGGHDIANLHDSQFNDVFIGRPDYSLLRAANLEYVNFAKGFERVNAIAAAGGTGDIARFFDSVLTDVFVAQPDYGLMRGENFEYVNYARGFDTVDATSALGGNDRAVAFDTSIDDLFFGRDDYFYLDSTSRVYSGSGFSTVVAHGINGGTNSLSVHLTDYLFQELGSWI